MKTLKERINQIRLEPDVHYNSEIRSIQISTNESIEDLLCTFYAGAKAYDGDIFENLSKVLLDHPDFDENPEYQYYYFFVRGIFFLHFDQMHYALESFQKANRLSYIVDDPEYIINSLSALSWAYDTNKDSEMALYYIEQALKIPNTMNKPIISANLFSSFGSILQNLGELDRAKNAYGKAITHYEKISSSKDHLNYCILLLDYGQICLQLEHYEEADRCFSNGISLAEKNDYSDFLGEQLVQLAEIYFRKEKYQKAYGYIRKYLSIKGNIRFQQSEVIEAFNRDKVNEELSSLYILRKQNENLNNRLIHLYDKFENSEKSLSEQKELFLQLNDAFGKDEIHCFFQPKWSLTEKKYTGAEALVRWIKSDGTMVFPDEFIGLIEETDMINTLSSHIIKQAFSFCHKIITELDPDFVISINIAPYQLHNHNVVTIIEKEILLNGLSPQNIEIEITERTFFDTNPEAMNQLYQLKDLGIKIALDDFGSGYSSLACLNRIPFDSVKIDRSLMINATSVNKGIKMLRSIINLLQELDFKVVTEGVETEEHVNILRKLKCDEAQGYFYSRAIPRADLFKLLQN